MYNRQSYLSWLSFVARQVFQWFDLHLVDLLAKGVLRRFLNYPGLC